jgi:rubrerythrin
MKLELERILDLVKKGQWHMEDLDWSQPVPEMTPETRREAGILLLLIAGFEKQAANTFESCSRYVDDPVAREIYLLFCEDERRHAAVQERLAALYGVYPDDLDGGARLMLRYLEHNYQHFSKTNPYLFFQHGSSYIALFELALDTILIPALENLTSNPLQEEMFRRIERDESRHLAMDYWLLERKGRDPVKYRAKEKLKDELRLAALFAAIAAGFGSFFAKHPRLCQYIAAPALIERFKERVAKIEELAPHASEVATYLRGHRGQKRLVFGTRLLERFLPAARP